MLLLIVIVLVYIVIAGAWAALIQDLGKFSDPLGSEPTILCGIFWPITMPYMCAKYVVGKIIWNVIRKIAEQEKDRRDNS